MSFSRDGHLVAYVSFPEGVLWKANRDGSNPVQLTDPPVQAYGSPLVARRHTDSVLRDPLAITLTPTLSPRTAVSPNGCCPTDYGRQGVPDWSPDGKKIVFDSATARDGKTGDLRILDLESRRVTVVPGSAGTWSPRWSPDGRYIAAVSWKTSILKVFDVETQQWSQLP